MFAFIATTAFYAALALLAFFATKWDRRLFWIGSWLVLGFLISNGTWWALHRGWIAPSDKAGIFSIVEIMVLTAVVGAWREHRAPALVAIALVNIASILANIGLASISNPVRHDLQLHETITNIFFAVECLLASFLGVQHGQRRVGRFARLPRLGLRLAHANAVRDADK